MLIIITIGVHKSEVDPSSWEGSQIICDVKETIKILQLNVSILPMTKPRTRIIHDQSHCEPPSIPAFLTSNLHFLNRFQGEKTTSLGSTEPETICVIILRKRRQYGGNCRPQACITNDLVLLLQWMTKRNYRYIKDALFLRKVSDHLVGGRHLLMPMLRLVLVTFCHLHPGCRDIVVTFSLIMQKVAASSPNLVRDESKDNTCKREKKACDGASTLASKALKRMNKIIRGPKERIPVAPQNGDNSPQKRRL